MGFWESVAGDRGGVSKLVVVKQACASTYGESALRQRRGHCNGGEGGDDECEAHDGQRCDLVGWTL